MLHDMLQLISVSAVIVHNVTVNSSSSESVTIESVTDLAKSYGCHCMCCDLSVSLRMNYYFYLFVQMVYLFSVTLA